MKNLSDRASIATIQVTDPQTKSALDTGSVICGVAHFPDNQHPDSSVLMQKSFGVDTVVRIEILTGEYLKANTKFEIVAGKSTLGLGVVRFSPPGSDLTPTDRPAPVAWDGVGPKQPTG